ncbi:MAG: hypothetical protein ACE5IK_02480 [Acidobacteriota bacterium]
MEILRPASGALPEETVHISSAANAILRDGLDLVGDTMVVKMRGGTDPVPAVSPLDATLQPLSPRRELVRSERPTFYWIDTEQPVRVVVALDDQVVWRIRKVVGPRLGYGDHAPELIAGKRYTWWLETTGRRHEQTRPESFRLPPARLRADMAALEDEMQGLASTPDAENMTLYLRSAYYIGLGAHSAALFTLQQLARRSPADILDNGIARTGQDMGLTEQQVALLDQIHAEEISGTSRQGRDSHPGR